MSTAAQQPQYLTRKSYAVKNAITLVKGVGVKLTATPGEVDLAAAGDKVIGIATEAILGDGVKRTEIILLGASGTVKVKVAVAGATAGEYAIAGTDGFEDKTVGGGTVVRHICGIFLETGVDNDFVEMLPMRMPAVSA